MTTSRGRNWARHWVMGAGGIAGMAVIGALVISTGSARAGKTSDPCAVTYGTNGAFGAMGAARDSSDGNQLVRCDIIGTDSTAAGSGATDGALTMRCVMIDATGTNARSCVSANRALIAAAQAVGDSKVTVTIKAGSPPDQPECSGVTVVNSSEFSPKTKTP